MCTSDGLDRIARQQDRSATFGLITRLGDPSAAEEDRRTVAETLAQLGDPRSVRPLIAIAEDTTHARAVRDAALTVLSDAGLGPEGAGLRAWWDTGDELLRAWVLREAERSEADLIEQVARDPDHPLFGAALEGIMFGFEEPEWQVCKIRGLDHPTARVRRIAADALLFDEPVDAEAALRRATGDDDTEVAVRAIEALRYYPSRETLRLLYDIGQNGGEHATAARESVQDLRWRFQEALPLLSRWTAPVADILGPPEPAEQTPATLPAPARPAPPAASELMRAYDEPDGPWARKLQVFYDYDWMAGDLADRGILARYFAGHSDPAVRDRSCRALAAWQCTEQLLELAYDPVYSVRKSAIYHLMFAPASREAAALTWDLVSSGRLAGTAGQEALRTCAVHMPRRERYDRLLELARTDRRESIRNDAIALLCTPGNALTGGRSTVPRKVFTFPTGIAELLLPHLDEQPLMTWAVHVQLLDLCRTSGIRPRAVAGLHDVDNLDLAEALASLEG